MSSRRMRITNTVLGSLKAKKVRFKTDFYIRDIEQRGFQIKVSPAGKKTYQVEARMGGTGRVKKFKIANVGDIDLPEAREQARVALSKIRSGVDPLLEKRAQTHEGKTLDEVISEYLVDRDLKERTIEGYTYLKNKRFKNWLGTRVKDITRHEIRDWYLQGKRKTPTQTEQAFRFLNSLMNYSMALEIINENPCSLVTLSGTRYSVKKRSTHIEPNVDLEKFLVAFTEYKFLRDSERVARDLIALILTTGLRVNEARTITWNNVDMDNKLFVIRDPKNRRDHVVPFTPFTYGLFKHRQENSLDSDYVFRIKSKSKAQNMVNFQKTLNNICIKADIPRVTPHDLRRTFATVLNTLDVGYADLKFLMNHKDRDVTTGIYIQPDIEVLRRHLLKVVRFYDHKIPVVFSAPKGMYFSRYADGTLRCSLYKDCEIDPVEIDDPTEEDPNYIANAERGFWEGG